MPQYRDGHHRAFRRRCRSVWHDRRGTRGMCEKRRMSIMEPTTTKRPRVINYPTPPQRPFARLLAPTPIPYRIQPELNARPGLPSYRAQRQPHPCEIRRMETIPVTSFPNPDYQFGDQNPARHRRRSTLRPDNSFTWTSTNDFHLAALHGHRCYRRVAARAPPPEPRRAQRADSWPRAFGTDTRNRIGNVTCEEKITAWAASIESSLNDHEIVEKSRSVQRPDKGKTLPRPRPHRYVSASTIASDDISPATPETRLKHKAKAKTAANSTTPSGRHRTNRRPDRKTRQAHTTPIAKSSSGHQFEQLSLKSSPHKRHNPKSELKPKALPLFTPHSPNPGVSAPHSGLKANQAARELTATQSAQELAVRQRLLGVLCPDILMTVEDDAAYLHATPNARLFEAVLRQLELDFHASCYGVCA
jgi:hypothetical protein